MFCKYFSWMTNKKKMVILEMNLLVGLDRPCGDFKGVVDGVASPRMD